jgi:hypothetical protein
LTKVMVGTIDTMAIPIRGPACSVSRLVLGELLDVPRRPEDDV